MTDLLAVELSRFWSRRLFRGLVILAMLGLITAGVIALVVSDDANDEAAIRAQTEAQVQQCLDSFEGGPGLPPEVAEDPRAFCEENVFIQDPRFPYNDMPEILQGLGVPFLMIAWLIGASFVGAEWNHRTMTTSLTWEPRRVLLFAAKLVALLIGVFIVLVLLQLFVLVAFLPAGLTVGNMEGIDGGWWRDLFEQIGRSGGVAALTAALGMSLAMIGRNTAAALGFGFVYFAVVESLIRVYKGEWADWLVSDNIALVLIGERVDVFGMSHGVVEGVLLLSMYVGLVSLAALALFKRRDLA